MLKIYSCVPKRIHCILPYFDPINSGYDKRKQLRINFRRGLFSGLNSFDSHGACYDNFFMSESFEQYFWDTLYYEIGTWVLLLSILKYCDNNIEELQILIIYTN